MYELTLLQMFSAGIGIGMAARVLGGVTGQISTFLRTFARGQEPRF